MSKAYNWNEFYIPSYMMDGLKVYVEQGVATGGFLLAVLCNDLKGAVERADSTNMRNLPAYVEYLYNHCPLGCWGSPKKVAAWIAKGGLGGKDEI